MRRLFSLLPLLLPLPNLVQAADPVCTLENRVCAENNNSGKCIRYETHLYLRDGQSRGLSLHGRRQSDAH